MPRLVVLREGTVQRQVELGLRDLVIGRADDSDVVLEDPGNAVSRHHAEVRLEDNRYVMIDVGSQNGIWNGTTRVYMAELTHGTVLSVGSFDIRFENDIDDALTNVVRDSDALVTWPPAAGQRGPWDEPPRSDDELEPTNPGSAAGHPTPPGAVLPSRVRPSLWPDVARATGRAPHGRWPVLQRVVSVWHSVAGRLARQPRAVLLGAGFGVVLLAVAVGYPLLHPVKAPDADRSADKVAAQSAEDECQRYLRDARGALARGMLLDARQTVGKALTLAPANGEARALQERIEELIRIEAARASSAVEADLTSATSEINTASDAARRPRVRQQPEVTPWPLLAGRPNETPEALRERSRLMSERYRHGESLLRSDRVTEAAVELAAIAAEEPSYEAVAALLLEARQGIAAQVQQAVDAASSLESGGDLAAAMSQYERARQLDPSLPSIEALIRQLRERMVQEGTALYTRAKQYDALGRSTEAADLYNRVLKLLPSDHPSYSLAQARVKALGTGKR